MAGPIFGTDIDQYHDPESSRWNVTTQLDVRRFRAARLVPRLSVLASYNWRWFQFSGHRQPGCRCSDYTSFTARTIDPPSGGGGYRSRDSPTSTLLFGQTRT
jgi:hypothetical protein